jgi:hypothetical protein
MTREDLVTLMRTAWTGDANSGLSSPLSADQVAMIDAQLGAIADGILEAIQNETPANMPRWIEQTLSGSGSVFTLSYVPVTGSLMVFRNDLPERGWSLVSNTLTLGTPRLDGDASLWVRYQAVVPT